MSHGVCFPLFAEVDEIDNLAPDFSHPLPAQPGDDEDLGSWRHHHAGPRQAAEGERPVGFHRRGLWRPDSSTPRPRTIWGNVSLIGEQSCDDEGEHCAETLFLDCHRQHKLKIKVMRIFNACAVAERFGREVFAGRITRALETAA